MKNGNVPARPRQWPVEGQETDGRKVAVMGRDGVGSNRDWHRDNRVEGRFIGELDRFLESEAISAALCAANAGKVGAPFKVPDAAVRWAVDYMIAFDCGYRSAARILKDRLIRMGFKGISYSQLHKRVGRLSVHSGTTDVTDGRVMAFGTGAPPRPTPITVIVDSTGLSPDEPSGWRVHRWDQRSVRGWYKLHAAIDSETGHILAYVVTEPYCNDSPIFERLIGIVLDAGHEVARVLADAAYDNKGHWNAMKERGIDFITNIHGGLDPKRRNSSTGRFRGCSVRGKHIRRILEVGREKWKKEVGYGERWRIEATFGDLKRRFGDKLRARARERVADMIGFLVQVFNRFKSTRMSI
ncbi:IS5 family transposase [Candidatus Methanoprimaticola sp. MG2]|uniref:IS5 family transposase n=1 Tax=Candidatus Methanoprimaticola sp. MG2 TaxID=3228838 RepID=UPI0039C73404